MRKSEDTRHAVRLSKAEVEMALKKFLQETVDVQIPDRAELYLETHGAGYAASFIWNTKDST